MSYPNITSAMLVLTHACNLRCRYCFVHKEPQTMTYQTAKDAVDFLVKNCTSGETPGINFFGGEPMLCWDSIIVPITEYIREELKIPFRLSMTTNGTLLNKDRIAFMKSNNIGMLFSIDGDSFTQNYNRPCIDGSGSFEMLRDLIPIIAREFRTTFRMTAIPETSSHIFENIMFAQRSGFPSFFIVPNVFESWNDAAWKTLSEEMRRYSEYWIQCYQSNIRPIMFSDLEKSLHKITRINRAVDNGLYREKCEARYKCGLGAGRFASIHPNGDLYACQEMTSNDGRDSMFWIGNIYSGVDEDRRKNLSDAFSKDAVIGSDCKRCKLRRICDGGCVANNYMITGDLNCPPETYCKWMQLLLGEAIFIMNSLSSNEKFIKQWSEDYGR